MTTKVDNELETFVCETLVQFGADPDSVKREARLEAIDVDSLDLVELAQMVDERYGIRVEPRDFEGVETVGDALDAIARKRP